MSARLVIRYDAEKNNWSWSFDGTGIPIVKLIGYIVNVQGWLQFRAGPECADSVCIIDWNDDKKMLSYVVNPNLPKEELIGTLELVKAQLVDGQLNQIFTAQQAAIQKQMTGLVLPEVQQKIIQ